MTTATEPAAPTRCYAQKARQLKVIADVEVRTWPEPQAYVVDLKRYLRTSGEGQRILCSGSKTFEKRDAVDMFSDTCADHGSEVEIDALARTEAPSHLSGKDQEILTDTELLATAGEQVDLVQFIRALEQIQTDATAASGFLQMVRC